MSWDMEASLKRALIRQGWIYGDLYFRIGNPFLWVDGPLQLGSFDFRGVVDLAQWYSAYYEEYPTPSGIRGDNYEGDYTLLENKFREIFEAYFPWIDASESGPALSIRCHALARIQDYCMLKKYSPDLLNRGRQASGATRLRHLDFGAGLGGSASYSLLLLGALYTAIEAHEWSYNIQRMFFQKMVQGEGSYLDVLAAETMEVPRDKIAALILSDQFVIKQVPAWYFSDIPSGSHDLVSATTVLNELNSAGIVHMLSQSSRVLQKGGYLYIRDSAKLKPGRHTVNYDKVLVEHLGFELVHWLDVRNRIDMFAIPRLYKKVKQVEIDFASLFDLLLGREAVTSHGGYYAQNLRSDLSEKKLPR